MWEFSLYFNKQLLPYFNDLKNKLKTEFNQQINCISIGIKDEQYVLMIALPKEVFNKKHHQLKNQIAQIICLYYKPYYIYKSLNNFDITNLDNKILLGILSSYESKQDNEQISHQIHLTNKLYLQSFLNFKLKTLVNKWQEIGGLINQNSLFLIDKTIKQELIKFLMAGLQSQTEILTISKQNKTFYIFDADSKKVEINTVFYAQTMYDNLLFAIINKFPKTINIVNPKLFSVNFLNTIYLLFGDTVKISN